MGHVFHSLAGADSLGEGAKIIDAARVRRTLYTSRDRELSVLRSSPTAAVSLGRKLSLAGIVFWHSRMLPPEHHALVRTNQFCRSIHLPVRRVVEE